MLIDWLKSLRSSAVSRRRLSTGLSTPTLLERRTLLSSVPVGPEFRVNSTTTSGQNLPAIALDADGDYVIAWRSTGQDGDGHGIYAQRFNAAGTPQGAEFKVNSFTSGNQGSPAIALDSDGDFVIAWQSNGQDGSYSGIYAQRYNAAGTPQGAEFKVNTFTSSSQSSPTIALDSDGDFVIVWQSYLQEGSGWGIYAQRYNAAGTPQGAEFKVNTFTSSSQSSPTIAPDSDGDFVIAWDSYGQDGDDFGIYAQRYNAAGTPQGAEFKVNSFTSGSQSSPTIALDSDGDFVIAWQSYGQDGDDFGIYAQRYNAAGTPQGAEFKVNSFTSGTQASPSIALDSDGDFVIAWQSNGQEGSGWGIYAQRFNAAGTPQGAEFRANSFTSDTQASPAIALDSDGDFIIAWDSYGQDGSNYGIYAQRFHAGKPNYLGVWRASQFYLDSNQSDAWNGSTTDTLNTFGTATDKPLVGDWNGDGYDDVGIWRNGTFYLDTNGNGVWNGPAVDKQFVFGNTTDTPLVGDWNKDGKDDVGVWRAGKFYLDLDGNRLWNAALDGVFTFGAATDTPLIGDWNGDGTDDLGVWRAGKFYLDLNANRVWNAGVDGVFTFGNPTDTPIVGKFNRDVADDIGVWRAGIFYLDYNSNRQWDGTPTDFRIGFGSSTDTPLIGNWRPKTIPGTPPAGGLPPAALPQKSPSLSDPSPQPDGETLASLLAPPSKKRDR